MTKSILSEDKRSIIEKLKTARKKAGLSQERAAKLLKKTQSYISKTESGQRRIYIAQLKEFARIY